RIQRPPVHLLREAVLNGRLLRLRSPDENAEHPLGAVHQALATCVTSEELAVLSHPPVREVAGLVHRDQVQFALTVPSTSDGAVLGRLIDRGDALSEVSLSTRTLNEHTLVVGTPGSGKTNTCMQILVEAHERFNIPFLVIEPAKTEFRRLA